MRGKKVDGVGWVSGVSAYWDSEKMTIIIFGIHSKFCIYYGVSYYVYFSTISQRFLDFC